MRPDGGTIGDPRLARSIQSIVTASPDVHANDANGPAGSSPAAWVAKVERIGALNFPEEARRRNLTGSLRLSVVIRADGTILETTVVRSSGQSALDEGARRIVELGAPYAPFPDELRRRYDTLVIVRDWQFRQGAQFQ